MARHAVSIHVVEKAAEFENLRHIESDIWETAYWVMAERMAESLKGGTVFVHRGQNIPSHAGGEILEIYHEPGSDSNRRVIRFRSLESAKKVHAGRTGWGNERKVIWGEK